MSQANCADPAAVIVAGHICLDIIPTFGASPVPQAGQLVRVGPAVISTGGAVSNTGLALHRLGVRVHLVGKVADDLFGSIVLSHLRAQGAGLADAMIVQSGEATSYTVVISPAGSDRSFLHHPGANDSLGADQVDLQRYDSRCRIFHFGYPPLMRRMYQDGGVGLAELMRRASQRGLVTSVDMAQPDPFSEAGRVDWVELMRRVMPHVDLFMPSVDELAYMLDPTGPPFTACTGSVSGQSGFDLRRLRSMSEQLLDMGTGVVLIKLGDQGLYLRTAGPERLREVCANLGLDCGDWAGRELSSPCFRACQLAGTTGSGDCTIAGFLAALLRKASPGQAVASANAVGACCVESPDATGGVPHWNHVHDRIARGWPRLPVHLDLGQVRPDPHGNLIPFD